MRWRNIKVAPCGTHHIRDDAPLYDERFDEVLKFHAPGLAPVRRGGEAWHIRADGSPAYSRRFLRTFGFYEGLAAVISPDGWHHIRLDGTELYRARYKWCGNFQDGRCTVREHGGYYFHITSNGKPAYDARWRYAGDYRDGVAVVQAEDGRSSHVDLSGNLIHNVWFQDLDVFHKGFARARDGDGWTHVDVTGRPVYKRRFAAVEPFYNGQARVERFDGGLEVIDTSGRKIVELRSALKSEFASLSDDLVGFWRTQTICAAVELGVFDALPATTEEVALTGGLVPERGRRLLRALAELRLVREEGGMWQVTERGEYLKATHPLTLADAAIEYGRFLSRMWEALPVAIRSGAGWTAPDIFTSIGADPDRTTACHRMLRSYALHDYVAIPSALKLRGNERVIDAGGGFGALAALLVAEYPELEVVVLDRPEVIERAIIRKFGNRVALQAANLFQPWGVEGDAVLLARVLHDWDDHQALKILRHARRAVPTGGLLFVIEMLLSENGVAGSLCDLHLLMVTGGRERTAAEYVALLDDAGFEFKEIRRIPALPSIVVGVAR